MSITVANNTSATGVEYMICGYVDGSANPPMWSGSLNPSGQSGSSNVVDVSGFVTYAVGFFPVGWLQNETSIAWSPQVTDQVLVALNINVG
ncbi:MAG TPA: hypothetical protein VN282_10565 [Pyrinomonadaceae bacterium]|nr:hypothetical protein [Pyrinomonadaceae bacterium]